MFNKWRPNADILAFADRHRFVDDVANGDELCIEGGLGLMYLRFLGG